MRPPSHYCRRLCSERLFFHFCLVEARSINAIFISQGCYCWCWVRNKDDTGRLPTANPDETMNRRVPSPSATAGQKITEGLFHVSQKKKKMAHSYKPCGLFFFFFIFNFVGRQNIIIIIIVAIRFPKTTTYDPVLVGFQITKYTKKKIFFFLKIKTRVS